MTGIQKLEMVQVIKTRTVCGTGRENDPIRVLVQYWDMNGKLIASTETHLLDDENNA